jgi:hypothetical protein
VYLVIVFLLLILPMLFLSSKLKRNLIIAQTRWLEFLSEYDFDIKHIKGKENKVVDAFSRRVHLMHATTISMHQLDLKSIILNVDVTD